MIEYLEHIEAGNAVPNIEKPVRSNNMKDVTTEFYANFIDLDDDHVQDLMKAANFLAIDDLLVLCLAKMGSVIRGLTIPEFRKRFNIINDFTPEEEAERFDDDKITELVEAREKELLIYLLGITEPDLELLDKAYEYLLYELLRIL